MRCPVFAIATVAILSSVVILSSNVTSRAQEVAARSPEARPSVLGIGPLEPLPLRYGPRLTVAPLQGSDPLLAAPSLFGLVTGAGLPPLTPVFLATAPIAELLAVGTVPDNGEGGTVPGLVVLVLPDAPPAVAPPGPVQVVELPVVPVPGPSSSAPPVIYQPGPSQFVSPQ